MREIKFRAWDKTDNRMIVHEQEFIPLKVTSIGVLKLNPEIKVNNYTIVDADRFELMQYTGLKDKNGVEIYEGDVVKGDSKTLSTVYWNNRTYGFVLTGGTYSKNFTRLTGKGKLQVIGNTYQNPDLCES
jgi:uncharacterized phage protein (TIGR01671 family)